MRIQYSKQPHQRDSQPFRPVSQLVFDLVERLLQQEEIQQKNAQAAKRKTKKEREAEEAAAKVAEAAAAAAAAAKAAEAAAAPPKTTAKPGTEGTLHRPVAKPGAILGLIGRDAARLADTAQACTARGASVQVLPADVRRRSHTHDAAAS